MEDNDAQEWPGKADGVPRPPTRDELDALSSQQGLITDEWGSEPAPSTRPQTDVSPPKPTKEVPSI